MSETTQLHAGKNWYDKSYKYLLIIPALLLIFSVIYLYNFYGENGDIIKKDVSLTGGTSITVLDNRDVLFVESSLKEKFPDVDVRSLADFQTGAQRGFYVETAAPVEEVRAELESLLGYNLTSENASIEFTGAALSSSFYQQLRLALIFAFVLMGIVVFLIFRTTVPSLAVIVAALADIIMTIVTINLLGVNVSTAGIVALLMLIGFSVDTDILLTSRVIKNSEGSINRRIYGAFKTGMFMTLTAIAAVGVSLWSIGTYSETLHQTFLILLIGLGYDIFNTWVTNASLLKWYAEVKRL